MLAIPSQARSLLDRGSNKGVVLRGAFAALVVRALGIAVAYLVQIFLAHWTDPEQYGVYAYAFTWVTVLAMVVPIGLEGAILRFVPTYLADRRWSDLRGIARRCPTLIFANGVAVTVIGSLIVLLVPRITESLFAPSLIIALWATPFMALLVFLEGFGRALGSVTLAYIPRNVGVPLLVLIAAGVWTAVYPSLTARWATVILLVSALFFVVLQSIMVGRQMPKESADYAPAYATREWLRVALPLMIVSLATALCGYVDVIVIGFFMSSEAIGAYNAASRTALLVWGAPQALSVLAAPMIGLLYARDKRELRTLTGSIIQWGFWPSLFAAVVFIGFGHEILGLFGHSFTIAYPALVVLVLGQLAGATVWPVSCLLGMTGHHDRLALIHIVICIVCIVLTIVLVPVLGILGAAIAKCAITIATNLWMVVDARIRTGVTAMLFWPQTDRTPSWPVQGSPAVHPPSCSPQPPKH